MNKPDINTLLAVIKLIDAYPSMDIKELRRLLEKMISISHLPDNLFEKVADAIKKIKPI